MIFIKDIVFGVRKRISSYFLILEIKDIVHLSLKHHLYVPVTV